MFWIQIEKNKSFLSWDEFEMKFIFVIVQTIKMIRKLFIAMLTRCQLTIDEDLLDLGETEKRIELSQSRTD